MVHTAQDFYLKQLELTSGELFHGIPIYDIKDSRSVLGRNPLVGSALLEDVWDAGGELVYPTSGETWELVSSSIADDSDGTGAHTVLVQYLDDQYVEQFEIVSLNGTAAVSLVATDAFRFIRMAVLTPGSASTVPHTNAGNITCRVESAGATRGQINAPVESNGLVNNSLDSHFTVPAGKQALLTFVYSNINKNEDARITMLSTAGTETVFTMRFVLSVYQNTVVGPIAQPALFAEKSDIVFKAISSNVNAEVVLAAQFVLQDI